MPATLLGAVGNESLRKLSLSCLMRIFLVRLFSKTYASSTYASHDNNGIDFAVNFQKVLLEGPRPGQLLEVIYYANAEKMNR